MVSKKSHSSTFMYLEVVSFEFKFQVKSSEKKSNLNHLQEIDKCASTITDRLKTKERPNDRQTISLKFPLGTASDLQYQTKFQIFSCQQSTSVLYSYMTFPCNTLIFCI